MIGQVKAGEPSLAVNGSGVHFKFFKAFFKNAWYPESNLCVASEELWECLYVSLHCSEKSIEL